MVPLTTAILDKRIARLKRKLADIEKLKQQIEQLEALRAKQAELEKMAAQLIPARRPRSKRKKR